MNSTSRYSDDNNARFDRAIGEYLAQADQRGRGRLGEARRSIVAEYPDLREALEGYFTDEDELVGTMAPFAQERESATGERVLRYVGTYELLALLGRGNMGEVYRARQANTGRIVAVKVMQSAAPRDQTCSSYFETSKRGRSSLREA